MDTKTYLERVKLAEEQKLASLKTSLNQRLEIVTNHLERQRLQFALSLYEQLKTQVEQTNNAAYEMYERKMTRPYPSETLKEAVHKSAKMQLESMLRTGNAILENFKQEHLR